MAMDAMLGFVLKEKLIVCGQECIMPTLYQPPHESSGSELTQAMNRW
jgi:hypothetical protein